MAVNSLIWNQGASSARRNLAASGRALNRSIQRISSGLRVNTAADDAAGMAISVTSRASIASNGQALQNAQDAIAMMQTTEGGIQAIQDLVIRMRELAVQSATDTLNKTARKAGDQEFQTHNNELDRIFRVTEYNGIQLLDGPTDYKPEGRIFQVGTDASASSHIKVALNFNKVFTSIDANTSGGVHNIETLANAQNMITFLDKITEVVQGERVKVGSAINRLDIATDNLMQTIENEQQSLSVRVDTDLASESAHFMRNQVLMQAGIAMLSQANAQPNLLLRLLN